MTRQQEVVRWLLFLPGLLVAMAIAAFVVNVIALVGGPNGWPGDIAASAMVGYASVRLTMALAPRGKLTAGAVFCAVVTLALLAAVVALPVDAKEVAKAAAWMVVMPLALVEARRRATAAPSPAARAAASPVR